MVSTIFNVILRNICLICIFSIVSHHDLNGQWTFNTNGNQYSLNLGNSALTANTNGTMSVSSSEGGVSSSVTPEGLLFQYPMPFFDFRDSSEYIQLIDNGVESVLSSVPIEKWFKAKSTKNDTLSFNYEYSTNNPDNPEHVNSLTKGSSLNNFNSPLVSPNFNVRVGSEESGHSFETNKDALAKINETSSGNVVAGTFQAIVNFPTGTTKGYVIIPFFEIVSNFRIWQPCGPSGCSDPTPISESISTIIIIPFIVEGPIESQVDSLGVTTQPQIPYMVIHNPPGDNSSTTVTNTGTKCRSFEEKVSKDESNETYGAVKVGFSGSIGFIGELDLETYVELSVSSTEGSFQTRSNSNESCVTVSSSITALSNGKGAQNNDLFVGYGIDLIYGAGRRVNIENGQVFIDTAMVHVPLPETLKEFFLTKTGIEDDIIAQQTIVNDSVNYTIAERALAQYQINVWRQVLDKNEANIAAAALQSGEDISFSGGASQEYLTSLSYNTTQNIEVEHFIESQLGLEGAVYFAGSGFKAGSKFTTSKSFGQILTTTGGQAEDVLVTHSDQNGSDFFTVKIVKDPVYGTPIFLLDSLRSKTSCPYEGGLQRDQPKLEINGSASPSITVSNISLGNAANFKVRVCNNSAEIRDYGFGFVNESIALDVFISSTAGNGSSPTGESITKLGTITAVPAGGCKTTIYDVNVARRFANSPMSYPNLEFVAFSECEPSMKSSIFANINFAGPPPPTGVAASPSKICVGTPVTLTANCPVTTTPRWYIFAEGGFPIHEGTSVIVNPSVNTTYYVGCETFDYKRDRIATQLVVVGSPSTVLSLTSDYISDSFQIANTTLTAANKIIEPARVTYMAGNSLLFTDGFEAKAGSTFEAKIGGCSD